MEPLTVENVMSGSIVGMARTVFGKLPEHDGTGRASDMFIFGGSNVYPGEIEEIVLTHPSVSEAAVVGVPGPKWGKPEFDGKLARFKRPAAIEFLGRAAEVGLRQGAQVDNRGAVAR
ncbi:MAG: hypothetical protein NVS2B17_17190 [Candidatus Velthaea sp.]